MCLAVVPRAHWQCADSHSQALDNLKRLLVLLLLLVLVPMLPVLHGYRDDLVLLALCGARPDAGTSDTTTPQQAAVVTLNVLRSALHVCLPANAPMIVPDMDGSGSDRTICELALAAPAVDTAAIAHTAPSAVVADPGAPTDTSAGAVASSSGWGCSVM